MMDQVDVRGVVERVHLEAVLTALGLLAVGAVLGIEYYAAVVAGELGMAYTVTNPESAEALTAAREHARLVATGVAAVGLISGTLLNAHRRSDSVAGGDA